MVIWHKMKEMLSWKIFEDLIQEFKGYTRNDIIDKDPDYQLIDLRNFEEFKKYHIQTAVNIPMPDLFSEENLEQLDPEKLTVLYTNGGTHAAQAWVLLHQLDYTNTVVLLGGLNYWVDVYSNPKPPEGVYADSEIFNYQFRVSAGKYLMGNMEAQDKHTQSAEPVKIKIPRRKNKFYLFNETHLKHSISFIKYNHIYTA